MTGALVHCLSHLEGDDLTGPSALLSKLILGPPQCAQQFLRASGLSPALTNRCSHPQRQAAAPVCILWLAAQASEAAKALFMT